MEAKIVNIDFNDQGPIGVNLSPVHLADLRASGLSDETIKTAGIYTETDNAKISDMLNRKWNRRQGDVLVFPYTDSTGAVVLYRVKPTNPPKDTKGKPKKYLSPSGSRNRAYIPPRVRDTIADPRAPIIYTEGEKKALCATQHGFPCIGLAGVENWHGKQNNRLSSDLERIARKDRPEYIAFDSDAAENEMVENGQQLFAMALQQQGGHVKIVRIPSGPDGAKQGVDDFLVAHGPAAFQKLLDAAEEPSPPAVNEIKDDSKNLLPEFEAEQFLAKHTQDEQPKLRYWRGTWWLWNNGQFKEVDSEIVHAEIMRFENQRYFRVRNRDVSDVVAQVKAQCMLTYRDDPPFILNQKSPCLTWNKQDILFTTSEIIHLPDLAGGVESYSVPATPAVFNLASVKVQFDRNPPPPTTWLNFLNSIWHDDQECIEALQRWFGYCLTADTSQQKILMLIGPKRSGKGTICYQLQRLVGEGNSVSPTLNSLTSNFGLWPLIGKTLAVVADARIGSRADSETAVERLLSISGEDQQTIDRKNQPHWIGKLPTRFVLATNELPRLRDASTAFVSRLIFLPMLKSFYGIEDHELINKLEPELPGILAWAVEGWRKLRERGRLLQPKSGEGKIRQQIEISAPVASFVADRCVIDPGHKTPKKDVYENFVTWCDERGIRNVPDMNVFGRDLHAVVPDIEDKRVTLSPTERPWCYSGISIAQDMQTTESYDF